MLTMVPKRLINSENKDSSESANVSEPQPSNRGFTGTIPSYQSFYMDGDSSSATSPPLLHYPSPAFTYIKYKSIL
ncbi:hypothetical protein E2C01_044207 [Portunus trituberculatus]|uniref:Uncharacterized protein n=1 Tax=Portunus trituberculatus TaxID=210409 RepID=A0A5B7FYQ0_PORTR|nr:hypothetical protein [Portunus trituberculatus]